MWRDAGAAECCSVTPLIDASQPAGQPSCSGMVTDGTSDEFEALAGSYRSFPVRPDLNDESAMLVDSVLYPGRPSPSMTVGRGA